MAYVGSNAADPAGAGRRAADGIAVALISDTFVYSLKCTDDATSSSDGISSKSVHIAATIFVASVSCEGSAKRPVNLENDRKPFLCT